MQNTDYKNLTDDELFVIMDEKNFLQSSHFENMKQLVKIDSEFKERLVKIDGEFKERFLKIRNSIKNSTKSLIENIIYKNLTDDELFVIMDEKNFFQSSHFENMKQLVKIDSEFKERFLKIRSDLFLLSNLSAESDLFKVAYQNLKSRGIL